MSADQLLPDANIRSQAYYVASTAAPCCHCGLSTRLLALAMPCDHETLELDDAPAPGAWQRANMNAVLFYVERLPEDVQSRLTQLTRQFRPEHSAVTLGTYWANHCEHCGTLLEDHELHCEPDGAFMALGEAVAGNIQLLQIHEPFEAVAAGYSFEPEFLRFMGKA
jgi:hypothetical protein